MTLQERILCADSSEIDWNHNVNKSKLATLKRQHGVCTHDYEHKITDSIDEQLKPLPKVIHTAYKDRAGKIRRSDVYLYADFSRTDVWLCYATKKGEYILCLVMAQTFTMAVEEMTRRVKELRLNETEIIFDERRSTQ